MRAAVGQTQLRSRNPHARHTHRSLPRCAPFGLREQNSILTKVKFTLAVDKDDPEKDAKVKDLRKDINNWVAKYRREPKVSGRPSFG